MLSIRRIAEQLGQLLSEHAEEAGRQSGCIQRQRKFSAATLVQTLVLGWLDNPDATLQDLTHLAAVRGVRITPQGLDQRFSWELAACLEQVLAQAVKQSDGTTPPAIPLLEPFRRVQILDSTTVRLPAEVADRFPGCSGRQAVLKLHLGFDLKTGQLEGPYLQPGRTQDRRSPILDQPLPAGSLRLADLGFFKLATLRRLSAGGSGWISRLQTGTAVFDASGQRQEVLAWLAAQSGERVEQAVELGVRERVPARLLALRVPEPVASARRHRLCSRARDQGRPVSLARLALADWMVLVTNIPVEQLDATAAVALYRSRWQIEVLIKQWKSQGKLTTSRSTKAARQVCEVLAKLIGLVIQHGLLLLSCWHDPQRSLVKAARIVRKFIWQLASSLDQPGAVARTLGLLQTALQHGCRRQRRKQRPNTAQYLLAPSLASLT